MMVTQSSLLITILFSFQHLPKGFLHSFQFELRNHALFCSVSTSQPVQEAQSLVRIAVGK